MGHQAPDIFARGGVGDYAHGWQSKSFMSLLERADVPAPHALTGLTWGLARNLCQRLHPLDSPMGPTQTVVQALPHYSTSPLCRRYERSLASLSKLAESAAANSPGRARGFRPARGESVMSQPTSSNHRLIQLHGFDRSIRVIQFRARQKGRHSVGSTSSGAEVVGSLSLGPGEG